PLTRTRLSSLYLSSIPVSLFFLMKRPPPRSPLFPYTTLFRSRTSPGPGPRRPRRPGPRTARRRRPDEPAPGPRMRARRRADRQRSEEHTSELQSLTNLVCRLLLEKKKKTQQLTTHNTR